LIEGFQVDFNCDCFPLPLHQVVEVDWPGMRNIIVQRVIERGRPDDFYAMLNKYSLDGVKQAIRQIPYLNKKDMSFVCTIFNMEKSELKCSATKRLKNQHWNS
jgi:hypothetical protein